MVVKPEDYRWSSYHERLGLRNDNLLDLDSCYLGLSTNKQSRIEKYKDFLTSPISDDEGKLLHESVKQNQLMGNGLFVDEVEKRIGLRIENRGRGRPVARK